MTLYVDNSSGTFTADEVTRISDAVANVEALVSPYGTNIIVVDSSIGTNANLVIDTKAITALGGYADGVLGATTDSGEITIVQGWNWYTGANAATVGANQFDFQTVVTHELGHGLGLGHSAATGPVMYGSLETGAAPRTLSVADLNIPDIDTGGACGLHVAPVARIGNPAYLGMEVRAMGNVNPLAFPAPFGIGIATINYNPAPVYALTNSRSLGEFGRLVSAVGLDSNSVGKGNTFSINVERVPNLGNFRSVVGDFPPILNDGVEAIPSTIAGDAVFEALGTQNELGIPDQPWSNQPGQSDHDAAVDQVLRRLRPTWTTFPSFD